MDRRLSRQGLWDFAFIFQFRESNRPESGFKIKLILPSISYNLVIALLFLR